MKRFINHYDKNKSTKLSRISDQEYQLQIAHDEDSNDDVEEKFDNDDDDDDENRIRHWGHYIQNKRQKFSNNCEERRLYLRQLRERALIVQQRTGRQLRIDPPRNRYSDVPLGKPEWQICDPSTLSPVKDYTEQVYEYLNRFYFEPEDPILGSLFYDVCIFVNGYTNPVASLLHTIMLFTGGRYTLMFHSDYTTHTIASVLSLAQRKSERARKTTVRPEWILESLNAKKLLPLYDFLVWKPKNTIREMFKRINEHQEPKSTTMIEKCSPKPSTSKNYLQMESSTIASLKKIIPRDGDIDQFILEQKLDKNSKKAFKCFRPEPLPSPCFLIDSQQGRISPELIQLFDDNLIEYSTSKNDIGDTFEESLKEILNDLNNQNNEDRRTSTPKVDQENIKNFEKSQQIFNQSDYIPKSESQLNQDFLNDLPEDIRKEIIDDLKKSRTMNQNRKPVTPKKSILPSAPLPPTMKELYNIRTTDTLSKTANQKTNSPTFKGKTSFRKTSIQNNVQSKKQLRIDFMLKREMIRSNDPKQRALDIYTGRRGSRQPNICGKTRLVDVQCLLHEWITKFEKLSDADVTYVLKYLLGLVDLGRFTDLKQILIHLKCTIKDESDQNKPVVEQWKMMFSETFRSVLKQEPSIPEDLFSDDLFRF